VLISSTVSAPPTFVSCPCVGCSAALAVLLASTPVGVLRCSGGGRTGRPWHARVTSAASRCRKPRIGAHARLYILLTSASLALLAAGCAVVHDPPVFVGTWRYAGGPSLKYAKFSNALKTNGGAEVRALSFILGDEGTVSDEMTYNQLIDWVSDKDYEQAGTKEMYIFLGMVKKVTFGPINVLGVTFFTGQESDPETDERLPSVICIKNIAEFADWAKWANNEEFRPDIEDIQTEVMMHEFGHQFSAAKREGCAAGEHCWDAGCVMFSTLNQFSAYDPPQAFCDDCKPSLGNNLP